MASRQAARLLAALHLCLSPAYGGFFSTMKAHLAALLGATGPLSPPPPSRMPPRAAARLPPTPPHHHLHPHHPRTPPPSPAPPAGASQAQASKTCLLYTSDAADDM
eukprot:6309731-Prymnesium_polylepis.1